MKEIPAKLEHNNTWHIIKLGIDENRILLPAPLKQEILFTSIIDLSEKGKTLYITSKQQAETPIKIRSVEKVNEVIRKLILNSCDAYRTAAYFRSPATKEGKPITEARWEKGNIVVVRSGLWLVCPAKQVCIPKAETAAVKLARTEVRGKMTDIIRIDHTSTGGEAGEGVSSHVLCPLPSLQALYAFLKNPEQKNPLPEPINPDLKSSVPEQPDKAVTDMATEIDAVTRQVAMLVYSGMDTHAIEKMLKIPHKELDKIYDKILSLELGEVISVRREIQLTPKGVQFINDATKVPPAE